MGVKGFNCVLEFAGDVVGIARNVDPTFEADEQDTSTRSDGEWDNWQQGKKRLNVDVELLWVPTVSAMVTLEDAWFNDSDLEFQITGPDGKGWSGTLGVLSLNPGPQDQDNAVMVSSSMKSRGQISQVGGS